MARVHLTALQIGSAIVALSVTFGCGKLAGVDEYEVSKGCSTGSFRDDAGRCVAPPECESDQIPLVDGGCADLPALKCGATGFEFFEPDQSTAGGCQPIPRDCGPDWLGTLGSSTCDTVFGCNNAPPNDAQGLFVKADAAPDGTGERGSPLRTIHEALEAAALRPEEVVEIHVFPGSYRGSLRFERPIKLLGSCPRETMLIGDPGRQVLEIGPNADGSSIMGLTLTGDQATAGIVVDGAENVSLGDRDVSLIVGPVSGPGITFEDTSAATSGRLVRTVVHRAVGKGIGVYGASKLDLEKVRVVDTQPHAADGSAIGILVAPSASISADRYAKDGFWNVANARRSSLSLVESRIDGARGAGILVEGSGVHINRTSIRNVVADARGRSAGVLARRWWLGDLAASVIVERSTIAAVEGAGMHLDDVNSAILRDTTIRDITPTGGAETNPGLFGGCAGNGVRARSRLPPGAGVEASGAQVQLERVVIERTGESALHLEGASAVLRESVIRDVRGCTAGLGDAVAIYGYDFSPASIDIETTRITGVTRAAVAAFGIEPRHEAPTHVSIERSLFESCSPILRAENANAFDIEGAGDNFCECQDSVKLCSSENVQIDSALLGFPECDERISHCIVGCTARLGSTALLGPSGKPNAEALPNAAAWYPDHDGLASQLGQERGCFTGLTVPGHEQRNILAVPGFTPVVGLQPSRGAGRVQRGWVSLASNLAFGTQPRTFIDREQPDARRAAFVGFQVARPWLETVAETDELYFGRGVVGVRAVLLDERGTPIAEDWGKEAYYFPDGVAAGDPNQKFISTSASGYFYNVPHGRYLLRLLPPEGRESMTCSVEQLGLGWSIEEQPNTFQVYAEAGVNTVPVRTFCEVQ